MVDASTTTRAITIRLHTVATRKEESGSGEVQYKGIMVPLSLPHASYISVL